MQKSIYLIILLFLFGCTTVPTEVVQNKERVAADLGIPLSGLSFSDAVAYTVVDSETKYASFRLGILALTKDTLYLARYSNSILKPDVKIPLNAITFAGVGVTGAFKHLQQLRLETSKKVIAINFSNSSDASAGYKEPTQRGVSALRSLDVTVEDGAKWVFTNAAKQWPLATPLFL